MLDPAMAFSHNKDASDDFSLFLRQLLNRSSSPAPEIHAHIPLGLTGAPSSNPDHPVPDQTHESPNATLSYWTTAAAGAPVDSDSMTAGSAQLKSTDNDTDDYESEEGPEGGLLRSMSRNSSKRGRAAEVHNLSEKRRRSRINEKMKALQNLIPNSNKTDKASMLDEAIEYLKQLQLQVQMLSMRNGMILNPMCMPGYTGVLNPVQLSQLGLNIVDKGEPMNANIPSTLHSDQTHQCDPSTTPLSTIMYTGAPFTIESPMPNQLGSFHMLPSSQNVCRDDSPQTNAIEFGTEASTPASIPVSKVRSQPSCSKNEARRVLQGSTTDPLRLLSSNLDGLFPRTTSSNGCLATLDQKADIF